ncbi:MULTISPECIES: hypothetical protein [Pseudoalteromonas]|uniref:Uncharacterized protein n=1 Tax=Pseudoalteromonas luteoviolacea (strain 2ta16) TaxID=1353533 RepID=V4HRN3_PSEL2|nr:MULTISPECIES: hypothetical protein [Pseudoalteromonas]ESP90584.1 hypothetical protein PL2TA16_01688 [Pseudoalteromonas luteoviolacea 2ta16]KZN41845.1 hypothetical protein N483_14330 [Pseudoalteromonas luteoviolacea NCIMB 1944]
MITNLLVIVGLCVVIAEFGGMNTSSCAAADSVVVLFDAVH